jgi:transcriptional regulator with XRE-family HTH domain
MDISMLGLNIRRLRERKGWNLNRLKEESGIGYTTLYDIENGNSQNLNSNSLERVSRALGVAVDELLSIEVIECTVSNIADILNDIINSNDLKLDGIDLNEYELEFIKDYLIAGMERIRNKRKIAN